jgi:chemotaxis protein CheC
MSKKKISQKQLDAFNQYTQEAMREASKSLSYMSQVSIGVEDSQSDILPLHLFYKKIGDIEKVYSTVLMGINHGLKGVAAVAIPREGAVRFAKALVQNIQSDKGESGADELTVLQISALEDAANILIGTFFAKLGKACGVSLVQTPPVMTTDMIHASLDEAVYQFAEDANEALLFSSEIQLSPVGVRARIIMVFNAESTRLLMSSL